MDEKVEALSNLIDKIVKKEILLPDFQRKFIWKEEEKQGRLIASVLAKMPIGSILLLDSDAKDYAYKMLGCRERKTYKELEMDGKILALLDGQQRVTVLTNAFSNVIFDMAKKSSNLINRTGLQRRFFLRIPKYERMEGEVEDFFQVRKLQFPLEDAEKEEPKFLSDHRPLLTYACDLPENIFSDFLLLIQFLFLSYVLPPKRNITSVCPFIHQPAGNTVILCKLYCFRLFFCTNFHCIWTSWTKSTALWRLYHIRYVSFDCIQNTFIFTINPWDRLQKCPCIRMLLIIKNFSCSPSLNDFTCIHDDNFICHICNYPQIMCDNDNRHTRFFL